MDLNKLLEIKTPKGIEIDSFTNEAYKKASKETDLEIKEASKISEVKTEIVNFRNMDGIKMVISSDGQEETANILIPNLREKSPALMY